jgi:hypothetical protein
MSYLFQTAMDATCLRYSFPRDIRSTKRGLFKGPTVLSYIHKYIENFPMKIMWVQQILNEIHLINTFIEIFVNIVLHIQKIHHHDNKICCLVFHSCTVDFTRLQTTIIITFDLCSHYTFLSIYVRVLYGIVI